MPPTDTTLTLTHGRKPSEESNADGSSAPLSDLRAAHLSALSPKLKNEHPWTLLHVYAARVPKHVYPYVTATALREVHEEQHNHVGCVLSSIISMENVGYGKACRLAAAKRQPTRRRLKRRYMPTCLHAGLARRLAFMAVVPAGRPASGWWDAEEEARWLFSCDQPAPHCWRGPM